jgi:hypothetical protein
MMAGSSSQIGSDVEKTTIMRERSTSNSESFREQAAQRPTVASKIFQNSSYRSGVLEATRKLSRQDRF